MKDNLYVTISFYKGWLVAVSGAGIGLVLGILYVWSVIVSGIPSAWGWSNADKALPYSIMAIMFSFMMVPAGQMQDRFGPRLGVMLGGFLAGLGCIIAGLSGQSVTGYLVGFGLFSGAGVGLGYAALTPAAIKWFPPDKTGLVAGIVVAGTGLAPVPLAPLTAWLLHVCSEENAQGVLELGVSNTMIALGLTIWGVIGMFSWFIKNPPQSFSPAFGNTGVIYLPATDYGGKAMLMTRHFWLLFFMYFSGASAGLLFIGVAAEFGKQALGSFAFLVVVVLSVGNTLGRIIVGYISDRIGRELTLFVEFSLQASVITFLYYLSTSATPKVFLILTVLFLIGMNYGANLTLFPALCRQYFGLRNFGLNYGWLFTAFGTAGLVMPLVNGLIVDTTGQQKLTYPLIVILLILSSLTALFCLKIGPPQPASANKE